MRKSPSGVPAGASERARSSSVSRCAKLSETEPGAAWSQPNKAAHEKAHRQQRSDLRGRSPKKLPGSPKELGERDSATHARQIDGPYVVQRNAREKRVDAQGKPFELFASDLRHAGLNSKARRHGAAQRQRYKFAITAFVNSPVFALPPWSGVSTLPSA